MTDTTKHPTIAFAGPRIGYIRTNEDGTHAKSCGCRWCVSRGWNDFVREVRQDLAALNGEQS